MTSPQLDFYAPLPDHVKMHKEKLSRQREGMFSWRSNHHKTAFDPKTGARKLIIHRYELEPMEVLIAGSQREADAFKKQRQQTEQIWDSTAASIPMGDRRREWKASGFAFDQEHFRTSSNPRSPYHPHNRPRITAALLRDRQKAIFEHPYHPYYHDRILFSYPRDQRGDPEVTTLALTCNTAEVVQRELRASRALRHSRMMRMGGRGEGGAGFRYPGLSSSAASFSAAGGGRGGAMYAADSNSAAASPTSMCEALGPTLASQQRQMALIEAMYVDLMKRRGALSERRGGESGEDDELHIRGRASGKLEIPTSEIAYSLRPEYLEKHHLLTHPSARGGGAVGRAEKQRAKRSSFVGGKREEVHRAREANNDANPTTGGGILLPPVSSTQSYPSGGGWSQTGENAPDAMVMVGSDGKEEDSVVPLSETSMKSNGVDKSKRKIRKKRSTTARSQKKKEEGSVSSASICSSSSRHSEDSRETSTRTAAGGRKGNGDVNEGPISRLLPTEAKATRLYAIHLRRTFTREELNMVGRQDPLRHGVDVTLPESWQVSSFTNETLRA